MNRIILIGNGFDLAHGLPTRYEDFINWYLTSLGKRVFLSNHWREGDNFVSFKLKDNNSYGSLNSAWYTNGYTSCSDYRQFIEVAKNFPEICEYSEKSILFSRICKAIESKGWVDIEREYYDLLRDAVLAADRCNYSVEELNSHLHCLQDLLTEYLLSIRNDIFKYNSELHHLIYGPLQKADISITKLGDYYCYIERLIDDENEYESLLYRYGFESHNIFYLKEELKRLKKLSHDLDEIDEIYLKNIAVPENILLLNFNYTNIADNYGREKVATINHIHGGLDHPESMIFGYGDELDDDYKDLLKQNDNECLRNIKSIKYLESDNYRNILQFIESAPYQVCIMGHSCGNSDRTLLNTLFEHKNCVSIKPYYYQKKDGSDNYLEIVQNICRNFTDMKLMRDRVVNKTFCEPLPQSKTNE